MVLLSKHLTYFVFKYSCTKLISYPNIFSLELQQSVYHSKTRSLCFFIIGKNVWIGNVGSSSGTQNNEQKVKSINIWMGLINPFTTLRWKWWINENIFYLYFYSIINSHQFGYSLSPLPSNSFLNFIHLSLCSLKEQKLFTKFYKPNKRVSKTFP